MRKLNSRYRQKSKSTDILSFPLHEQKGAPGTLPEVKNWVIVVVVVCAQFFFLQLSLISKVLFAEEMELGEMVISMPYVFCLSCL